MEFEQLRVADLKIIESLPFAKSIRELARQLRIDPQNLTRRIKQIEELFGIKLIERSTSGMSLSTSGERFVETVTRGLKILEEAKVDSVKPERQRIVRVCGRGYMVDYFLYKVFPVLNELEPQLLFDCMDLSPELAERAARNGLLDVVFSFGDVLLGDNFQRVVLPKINWEFVVRPGHPLSRHNNGIKYFGDYPLLGFCYIESDRLISRASPLIASLGGSRGCGAENSRYALQMVRQTDSIAYLPSICVNELVEAGLVQRLAVLDFQVESRALVLHANKDRVRKKTLKQIVRHMSAYDQLS